MSKTLYSLMLSEEVVREVDALAHRLGTNRSNLINQILAEYVDFTTPERRISDIFRQIEALIAPGTELIPYISPNTQTMSLKSSLSYKYRPTVKYEVELYRDERGGLGALSVIFRTQSAALITAMTDFFRLWKRVEERCGAARGVKYALYDGKFVRSIAPPQRSCTAEELAGAISGYVRLFDRAMKGTLSGEYGEREVEALYAAQRSREDIHI